MQMRAWFLVSLLSLSVLAEELSLESYGFRRLVATHSQEGPLTQIIVDGECSYPNDTSIDIYVEHHGEPCEGLVITVYPRDGFFSARMSTMKRILPGYYVVKAQFRMARQEGDVLKLLRTPDGREAPEKNAIQAFSIGEPAQIKAIREEQLKLYEAELATIEKSFAAMADTYEELVKKYDMRESPLEWNRKFGNIPMDCQTAIDRLKSSAAEVVIPVFPLIDSWTIEGWGLLSKLFNHLTEGLTIEITEMMSRKGTDRHYFLKKARQEMANFLKGMRAQIALERKLEQREMLVNDITELARLYEESSSTYEQAKTIRTEQMKKAWEEFMSGADGRGGWRGDLKAVGKRLGGYRGSDLEREYKELVDMLTGAPLSLEKLWDLYDRVVAKGEDAEAMETQIRDALNECYIRIYPVMDVLGFNREVFNRLMGRYQGSPEDGAPEDPVTGTMAEYIARQVQKLGSGDTNAAGRAMQILLSMKDTAKRTLKEMLEKGGIENSKIEGLIVICLGRLGDRSVVPRLINLLQDAQDDSIRSGAALALGQLGGAEMLAPLQRALAQDKSPAVRAAAANALPLLGRVEAIPDLLKAFMDEDLQVRKNAEQGAETLAKVDLPYDPGADEPRRLKAQEAAFEWWESNKERLMNAPADAREPKE